MLHELGHAVYSSKNIPQTVPWSLRTESHMLTTEGIAMLFQRFAKSGHWLERMGIAVDAETYEEAGLNSRRRELLVFSRWCQVMYRFEKALYENPDRDLNEVWWELVERYQEIRRPERLGAADFAAKIHICSAPVYYHNYLMGELFACQTLRSMARELQGAECFSAASAVGDTRVGDFLRARVFAPGKTLPWNELTAFATGEPLGAEAFAVEFERR
jgi:peptidyl-dipeptidase A